ncbi:MAG TPA: acetate--CoA ligase family protein, partial [Ilumatobacteraceae bacterium]|nr:acetate--CoA ligase family protein [Ilumatobacteraceae bacterium]
YAALAAYGISAVTGEVVGREHAGGDEPDGHRPDNDAVIADALIAAARRIGYPVVIKAAHRRVGRSAQAGIALDLANDDDVRTAVATIRASLGPQTQAFTVQAMTAPGIDVRIRCATDDQLGPVITLDLGSLQEIDPTSGVSRLPPISRVTAQAMVDASRVGAALTAAGIDAAPVVDAVMRVGQLMFDHSEIRSIEINPAIATSTACVVTDVTIVADDERPSDFPIRRLG